MTDEQQTVSKNILTKVNEKVEECFLLAEAHYGEKIPRAKISFDLTGTSGGTSCYAKKALRFNRKLLVANEDYFLNQTCPHEVSHHVCRWKYGYAVDSHGREWKKIMVEIFRTPPKRCHNLDVSKVRRKTKEYRYVCNCVGKTHMFGLIHHKRANKGNAYACPKCQGNLTYEGKGQRELRGLQETELD